MDRFFENAHRIFETAVCAGEPSGAAILIGAAGEIRIVSDSGWPLDRLAQHHGARAAYQVSARCGRVVVDGYSPTATCRIEGRNQAAAVRSLISPIRADATAHVCRSGELFARGYLPAAAVCG